MKAFLIGIVLALSCGIAGFFFGRSLNLLPEAQVKLDISPSEKKNMQQNPPSKIEIKSDHTSLTTPDSKRVVVSLPSLDDSDQALADHLSEIINGEHLMKLFNLNDIVRRFVITIDNATTNRIPIKFSLTKPLDNDFAVDRTAQGLILSEKNFARYNQFIEVFLNLDVKEILAIYVHYYPLFQNAYRELGTNENFNSRLIEVIDNALAAPQIKKEVKLEHAGYYEFADSDLESCSIAQKILIRVGPVNAKRMKKKLLNFKGLLIHLNSKLK